MEMPVELELEVRQENLKPGRTFSEEGLRAVGPAVIEWAGSQLLAFWDETGIPPTRMVITARIDIQ